MPLASSALEVKGETFQAVLCSHRGRVNADLRWYYTDKETQRLRPGRRGVSVPAHTLPWLIEALQGLVDQAVKDGYLRLGKTATQVGVNPAAYPSRDW